jgi:hypothetical protein
MEELTKFHKEKIAIMRLVASERSTWNSMMYIHCVII